MGKEEEEEEERENEEHEERERERGNVKVWCILTIRVKTGLCGFQSP